jgi:hypothetical protein
VRVPGGNVNTYAVTLYLEENGYRRKSPYSICACSVTQIVKAETMSKALEKLQVGNDCTEVRIVRVVGETVV